MTSLVQLAQENRLPAHQYMDKKTLVWVRSNRPLFQIAKPVEMPAVCRFFKSIKIYVPKTEWFCDPLRVDTIHGLRHILRVLIHATNISLARSLKQRQVRNCAVAASLHDIRRLGDRGDENHGLRSAQWFKNNLSKVRACYGVRFDESDIEEICLTISFHETAYADLIHRKEYKKHKEGVDILKTADALDRYCQPKLKWWISDDYLKICPSDAFKLFAYELVVRSEDYFLKNHKNCQSVFQALEDLCQLHAS